ncbi:putative glycosyltransferase [groundwater metagenome]|uniref:Putative glycosyltransferase n=1 Tax=groundwater metagenome TaxID=717931 RepID=A0A098E9X3_9ZZZZ
MLDAYKLKNVYIHKLNFHDSILKILPVPCKSVWLPVLPHRKIIKEINPDIVHGHNIIGYGLSTMFSGDYPKVISLWGGDVTLEPKELIIYKLVVKTVFKGVNMIHSFADNLTDESILLGVDKNKIVTITPAVDTKNFNLNVDGSEIRKLLCWESNPIVISTRNIGQGYNIECLIKSIPLVIKEIPDVKFIIKMGHVLFKDDEKKLKNMVKKLGISNSVKFIDYVKYEELPKYLACADVYVSTSLFDGLGISNIEALACGTPAVLADIDSTRNLIKKGLHAHLYLPKDSNALAKEIVASIKNREKDNKEIHKENFRIIKEHYDFDKNIEKIEQLYKDLIDKYKK